MESFSQLMLAVIFSGFMDISRLYGNSVYKVTQTGIPLVLMTHSPPSNSSFKRFSLFNIMGRFS